MKRILFPAFILLFFLLSGCSTNSTIVVPPPTSRPTASSTATSTPSPTNTHTPTATHTLTPSATPTSTSTPTPTATAAPTHPLMIELNRLQEYPGSALTLEQTLESGSNYDRSVVSYESEGNTIYALLTEPWGDPPPSGWPVILFNHGWIQPEEYSTTTRYLDYVDAIARSGYIVLRSDYRGHGRSEGEAIVSYRSSGYTTDVLNALASIQQYPGADPNRIGMWGHSMGGHITLRAMVISDQIKAGVIWGGVVVNYPDLFSKWRHSTPPGQPTPTPWPTPAGGWRTTWADLYGSPEENPDFYAAISANSFLEDISGPVQLHHGTADTSVPYEFSEILAAEMEAADRPVELYLYDSDNHNLVVSFWTAMNRSIAFFDKHVKGE